MSMSVALSPYITNECAQPAQRVRPLARSLTCCILPVLMRIERNNFRSYIPGFSFKNREVNSDSNYQNLDSVEFSFLEFLFCERKRGEKRRETLNETSKTASCNDVENRRDKLSAISRRN